MSERILIIGNTRIGDTVLASGVVKSIFDRYETAGFTIVTSPLSSALYSDMPRVDRLIEIQKNPDDSHWKSLWTQLRPEKWRLVVDFKGSGIGYLLRAKERLRYKRKLFHIGSEVEHKVRQMARLIRAGDDPPSPYLFVSPERSAEARSLVGDQPVFAIGPGASSGAKTWPADRYAQVAEHLLRRHAMIASRLLLLGDITDRSSAEFITNRVGRQNVIDLTGRIDILTAYACLQQATGYLGNDSGLMHLASASGVKTVGLFGQTDPRLYGPWGANGSYVAARGTGRAQERSIADITVEEVVQALDAALSDQATTGAHAAIAV
jgi:ADP-heptose:LPS heptosyltransferase